MSIVLKPYNEVRLSDLSQQLHELAKTNKDMLLARNIGGVVSRYATSLEQAEANAYKGVSETAMGRLGHYAIYGDSGDIIGAASIIPELSLYKQLVPVPAKLGRRLLSYKYADLTHNIHAWTNGDNYALQRAYFKLRLGIEEAAHADHIQQSGSTVHTSEDYIDASSLVTRTNVSNVWTIEPVSSSSEVHQAITLSGLDAKGKQARYDDLELAKKIPPKAQYYSWGYVTSGDKVVKSL